MESSSIIETSDRLSLTLCLAIIFHVMVVLGVGFKDTPEQQIYNRILNISLVPIDQPTRNETAKILAQTSVKNLDTQPDKGDSLSAERLLDRQFLSQSQEVEKRLPISETDSITKSLRKPVAELNETAQQNRKEELELTTPRRLPTATQLLTRSFALAALNTDLQQRLGEKANRPRRKYISANTKEYRYAAYMEAWRAKVERVGNLNYPEKARRKALSGALLLDVAIKSDGSVHEILVRRSSGHKELDEAAKRIVEMAAPFSPFPTHILEEVDILHITRTWKFLNNKGFGAP